MEDDKRFMIFYIHYIYIFFFFVDWIRSSIFVSRMKYSLPPPPLLWLREFTIKTICREEFLTKMLVKMNKVEQEDIDKVLNQFEKLDTDNSGTIDIRDLETFSWNWKSLTLSNVMNKSIQQIM